MTNQERAERIVRETSYGYADTELRGVAPGNVRWVTAQLDEAVREALINHTNDQGYQLAYITGKIDGFASAVEKAAGITSEHLFKMDHSINNEGYHRVIDALTYLNERIRALRAEEKRERV